MLSVPLGVNKKKPFFYTKPEGTYTLSPLSPRPVFYQKVTVVVGGLAGRWTRGGTPNPPTGKRSIPTRGVVGGQPGRWTRGRGCKKKGVINRGLAMTRTINCNKVPSPPGPILVGVQRPPPGGTALFLHRGGHWTRGGLQLPRCCSRFNWRWQRRRRRLGLVCGGGRHSGRCGMCGGLSQAVF